MELFRKAAEGVYALGVPFFDGSYRTGVTLVRGETDLLIDSGESAAEVDACILPALAALGVDPRGVGLLLATHTHEDHVGGHARLAEATGAEVVFPPNAPEKVVGPVRQAHPNCRRAADGERFGGRLRLVAVPGHALDAAAYFDEPTGTLVTGDAFQAEGTAGVGLALVALPAAYEASVARARALRPARVVAGHAFDPFPALIEGTAEVERFFDRCLSVLAEYRDALAAFAAEGMSDVEAMLAALLARTGRRDTRILRGSMTVRALLAERGLAHTAK